MIDIAIDTLVPHRRPLRLIDGVLSVADDTAETEAVVTPDWPTVAQGAAHVLCLIELVAQTAAIIGGLKAATNPTGARPHKGMLVGIKQADFAVDRLPIGTRIVVRATTRPLMDNFKQIEGIARVEHRIVAEMTLQGIQTV